MMNKKNLSPSEKLLKAVWKGSIRAIKEALDEGADINAQDSTWGTALFIASQHNHPKIVHFLLSRPGIDIVKGLVSTVPQGVAGCYFPLTHELHNRSPLYAAIDNDDTSIMRMILSHPDKYKYMEDKKQWESLIQGTFNYCFSPFALAELLLAAKPYPKLFQFTVNKAKRIAKSRDIKTQNFDDYIEKLLNWKRLSKEEKINLFNTM